MSNDKWKGTASCKIKKEDGKIVEISASCFGELSYENAKKELEIKIKASVDYKKRLVPFDNQSFVKLNL